jgi:hypothetical protein
MGRQGAAVQAASCGTLLTLGDLRLALGVPGRLDLLDILQSQLELFLRQGFCPPPEPVSLQLFDDLT